MILWFYGFFSSTTSKAFQKSVFPQHFLRSLGVIMSGAVGAGSRGKQTHWVHPCPLAHCRTPVPRFTQRCLFMNLPLSMCPTSAKPPYGAFFWGIGTNPWAVKSWVTSNHKVGFRIGCFLKWRVFHCGIRPLAQQRVVRNKKITILLINLGCTSGAHVVLASWLEGERWVSWCRWSGNLIPANFYSSTNTQRRECRYSVVSFVCGLFLLALVEIA